MKANGITRKSVKEQELTNFFHLQFLSAPGTIVTDQLEVIKACVAKYEGKPVKAVYVNKRQVAIEIIELHFGDQDHHFFKETSWEHWYEIFKTQQLQFIFIPRVGEGKNNWYYKLSK